MTFAYYTRDGRENHENFPMLFTRTLKEPPLYCQRRAAYDGSPQFLQQEEIHILWQHDSSSAARWRLKQTTRSAARWRLKQSTVVPGVRQAAAGAGSSGSRSSS